MRVLLRSVKGTCYLIIAVIRKYTASMLRPACCLVYHTLMRDVAVHIVGMCEGRTFEDRDVTFIMGCGSEDAIVPGVEMALRKFHRGEKSRLKVGANYGYGSDGCPAYNIAPGAELTYEVEMRQFVRVIFSQFICLF